MALYSYLCPTCHTLFEAFAPVEQRDPPQTCPDGHPGGKRRFTPCSIHPPDPRQLFRQKMSTGKNKFFT